MTKQSITSTFKTISDDYQTDTDDTITMFLNDTSKYFSIRITVGLTYCGTIYCDCIRIDDDNDLIQFINDGKTIAIFDYLAIDEIDLLYL